MSKFCFVRKVRVKSGLAVVLAIGAMVAPGGVCAETLVSAMSSAYMSNPDLNSARAGLRAVDELVPQALSGWRPQIFGSGTFTQTRAHIAGLGSRDFSSSVVGVTIQQPLFRGFQTVNSTKQAEATVQSNREGLRNTEQNTLFNTVQSYMNVLTDQALVLLQQQNIEVLAEQLRATRDRFQVGEVTNTDVAQAEAALSGAYTQFNSAQANLSSSRATYRQVVGREPVNLSPASGARFVPASLDEALRQARDSHPAIIASVYSEEAASYAVKTAEGILLPTISLQGSAEYGNDSSARFDERSAASITAQITIPIYQGGFEYSQVRQAKETRTQATLQIDSARQQVRAAVVSAWGALQAATASITSAKSQVKAAQIALDGVREEAKVGQRTTLDVLDTEQDRLDANVSLVTAESDRVVASYAVISAIGRLTARNLKLAVEHYVPTQHYQQVRDRWFGLRTPAGQ